MQGKPLQTLGRGGRIVNHDPLGRVVRDVGRRALRWFVDKHGCGFQDGGCRVFADALHAWSLGDLRIECVVRKDDERRKVQHFIATHGDTCLDSDGLTDRAGMIGKMDRFEGPHRHEILPPEDCGGTEVPMRDAKASRRIAASLSRRMTFRIADLG